MSSRKERRKRRAEEAAANRTTATTTNVAPVNVAAVSDATANDVTEPHATHVTAHAGPESLAPAAIDVDASDTAQRDEGDTSFDDTRWSPEAFARRARLAKYVGGAVAACALLGLIAGGVRYGRNASAEVAAAHAANPVVVTAPPQPLAPEIPPPPAPADVADEPATPELPALAEESPAQAAPTGSDRDLARLAKRASHRALEIGHVVESIEAGTRSVALDPSDREAWLILGAAYLQHGEHQQAIASFQSCLKEGTRGETWQCSAMLRH